MRISDEPGFKLMPKKPIETIYEKNRIINNIIDVIVANNCFLILGHENPDEDCLASTVAIALILAKFSKRTYIYQSYPIHEHFNYLMNICSYNSINIIKSEEDLPENVDIIICCDTPKPSMLDKGPVIDRMMHQEGAVIIEFDHHIGGDSEYIGTEGFAMVSEASSASELVGYMSLKLRKRKELLSLYNIEEHLSRNFVLAVLTGIIGDSKMGNFLKSRRERRYYTIFSHMYSRILTHETIKKTNISNMNEIFDEIQKLSSDEEKCSVIMMRKKRSSSLFGYIVMHEDDMNEMYREFDSDTIVSISRGVVDTLAEESGLFGLFVYYDDPVNSDLIQFRMRRSTKFKKYDLRNVLELFSIKNGGGHEGAIGFRFPRKSIDDIELFVMDFIEKVEDTISSLDIL